MGSKREQSLALHSSRQRNKLIGILTLSILSLCLFIICRQVTELRVITSGSPIPRNYREQTIFDYFYALKDNRCQDAYELRDDSQTSKYYDVHIKSCMSNEAESLPVVISIGEETKSSFGGENCEYSYIVYVAYPVTTQLVSSVVGLVDNPQEPGKCQIIYNSAFGDP